MDGFKCIILKGSSPTYYYSVSNTFKFVMFEIKLIARSFSTNTRHMNVDSESFVDLNIKYHKPFKPRQLIFHPFSSKINLDYSKPIFPVGKLFRTCWKIPVKVVMV